jgi:hypothetical protein
MTQYGRPDGDISAGGWTYSTGSTLYGTIDEVTPSDTDYDQSANNPSADTFECSLSSVTDPTDHTNTALKCRVVGQGTGTFNFQLIQGTTVIASYGVTSWPTLPSYTTYTLNLTTGEAANITDYTDLRVRVIANKTSGGLAFCACTWSEFSCPDAGVSPITINLAAAAVTATGQVMTISPAAASVELDAAAVTAAGQLVSIVPGAASVSLGFGSVSASGQVISIVPAAASISLDAGIVTANGLALSVVPGAAITELDAGSLTAAGQIVTILTPITINLNVAALTSSGKAITIVPAAVSVELDTATLSATASRVKTTGPGGAVFTQHAKQKIIQIPSGLIDIHSAFTRNVSAVITQYYIDYNATTTKVDCGSDASLQDLHDAAMTVECWVKPDGWGESNLGMIVAKEGKWVFFVQNTTGLRAGITCATTSAIARSGTDDFTTDGLWHHIAFTWDDASYNYPRLWIDGVEPDYEWTQNRDGLVLTDSGVSLGIGNRLSDSGRTWDGGIAWVRISNIVRYTSGFTPPAKDSPPATDANTVEQWNFNDGSGSTAEAEESSPTNDGTITDGSWISF